MTADARDAVVLDIGSNSVRLVVYRLEGRAIWAGYNEKVLAGLGREVARTRRLSPDGVDQALTAIRRFRVLMDAVPGGDRHVVATAAVRDAEDGPAFVERVRKEAGVRVRVLSGEEEARFAALGVLAGTPEADGVVADLGGSSLELTPVSGGKVERGVTLPLGPFAMEEIKDPQAEIDRRLETAEGFSARKLYAVGGAWRSLALLHMRQVGHGLEIVHEYEMTARQVHELSDLLEHQSKSSLERLARTNKARAVTLPHAARVLSRLVDRLGADRICFSAFGLREGLLLDGMPDHVARREPLVEGCRALAGGAATFDRTLNDWVAPILTTLPPQFGAGRDAVLIQAASALTDIGSRLHPDHRADVAFEQVLRAPVAGVTHPERAFLAAAAHARCGGGNLPEADLAARLLGEAGLKRAKLVGLALRLGCDLSGRAPSLLDATRLHLDGDDLVLTVRAHKADVLLGEKVTKRLSSLAQALGKGARLEVA